MENTANYKVLSKCRDYSYLCEHLSKEQLSKMESVLTAYAYGKIDMDIPRDDTEDIDFSGDFELKINDPAYKEIGDELEIMRWYEGYGIDTDYLVEDFTLCRNKEQDYEGDR